MRTVSVARVATTPALRRLRGLQLNYCGISRRAANSSGSTGGGFPGKPSAPRSAGWRSSKSRFRRIPAAACNIFTNSSKWLRMNSFISPGVSCRFWYSSLPRLPPRSCLALFLRQTRPDHEILLHSPSGIVQVRRVPVRSMLSVVRPSSHRRPVCNIAEVRATPRPATPASPGPA